MIGKEMSCYFTLKVNKFDDNLLQKFRLQILQPPPRAKIFIYRKYQNNPEGKSSSLNLLIKKKIDTYTFKYYNLKISPDQYVYTKINLII